MHSKAKNRKCPALEGSTAPVAIFIPFLKTILRFIYQAFDPLINVTYFAHLECAFERAQLKEPPNTLRAFNDPVSGIGEAQSK